MMDEVLVIHTAKFHYVALADEESMRSSSFLSAVVFLFFVFF
jgi:hypothetical protein